MTDQLLIENINRLLSSNNYASLVTFLEEAIETDPYVPTYYWYLGLAHLLQEKEEEAQATWLLAMSEGDDSQLEKWTAELISILEQEAIRQVECKSMHLGWLIRGYIREIAPYLINNLLILLELEFGLGYYDPTHLGAWEIVSLFSDQDIKAIELKKFLTILPNILEVPAHVNLDLLYTFSGKNLNDSDIDDFLLIVEKIAVKMAYEKNNVDYAIELSNFGLSLQPNSLSLLDNIYWFSMLALNFDSLLESAETFLKFAEGVQLKLFGYYKLINALIHRGNWKEANKVFPFYISFLRAMVSEDLPSLNSMIRQRIANMATPLLYFQDNPQLSRSLQNQLSALFYKSILDSVPFPSEKINRELAYPKRLRIGYIAHTLRRHSVGWIARWLIHYHNRKQFTIILYLMNQKIDDITLNWFQDKVDYIYNFPLFPKKISQQIINDEIDILVDLDSFSHSVTCQVLTLKPAPVQVTWLGFDASGLPSIDYFIADPYVLPEEAQEYYQEKIWRLPLTYLAIDGFEVAVPTLKRENLGIPDDAIIYLSVQAGTKRHPNTIHLQMQILKAVSNSYLLIKGIGKQEIIQKLFQDIARQYEINFDRLRFLEICPSEEIHRANLSIADIILDTYPYNGATTTLESLWMGIPLVTQVGKQFAARNSYTFMVNAGISEGIAWNDEEYINWGIRFGTDEQLRQHVQWKLQQSKKNAPIWNAKEFTKEMEKAYQQMWIQYLKFSS